MAPNNTIIVAKDAQHLARIGADLWMKTVCDRVEASGRCSMAVSGGSTPRLMHRRLADAPYGTAIPWLKLHLFWVDERLVAWDDPASNYGTAKKDFLDRLALPAGNIHPMPVEQEPEAAAKAYQRELEHHFGKDVLDPPIFDLVFLGIGTDGHTASIFPGDPTAESDARWVAAVKGGTPDVPRLTLTYIILNSARRIVFLVAGAAKAAVVRRLLSDKNNSLPPRRIRPQKGDIYWMLDAAAAELLPPDIIRTEAIR